MHILLGWRRIIFLFFIPFFHTHFSDEMEKNLFDLTFPITMELANSKI